MSHILYKMKMQWKTLKQGFKSLNKGQKGNVDRDDLTKMLERWGIQLSTDKVEELFKYLDLDKDGRISYKDFQNTIGMEITP